MTDVVIASFNVHAGVDGWGRPHDVLAACRSLDADVLVLQEVWTPEGADSVVAAVAAELGYSVRTEVIGRGRLLGPRPGADDRWGPGPGLGRLRTFRLQRRPDTADPDRRIGSLPYERGSWGVAVLSRLPVLGSSTLDLGKLPLDRARRVALVVQVETGSGPLTVVGTHMSHLTDGSPLQFLRLRRALPSATGPAVLVGDMNIWGPPLSHFLPGWRRAVRGRTWPAWRPLAQPDHILVTPAVGVVRGEVVRVGGSDHWPVRARLTLD